MPAMTKPQHRCWSCRKTFVDRGTLVKHMAAHENKPIKCPACPKNYLLAKWLDKHVRAMHRQLPVGTGRACPVCHEQYRAGSTAADHEAAHASAASYACGVCRKSFARGHHLATHIKSHIGVKCCACSVCGHRFAQMDQLVEHVRRRVTAAS